MNADVSAFIGIGKKLSQIGSLNVNMGMNELKVGSTMELSGAVQSDLVDWAYGGGWNEQQQECNNVSKELIDKQKENVRALMFRVSIGSGSLGKYGSIQKSLQRWPPCFYGNMSCMESDQVLREGYGSVGRGVMMSLGLIDLMQGYLIVNESGNDSLSWQVGGCE